MFENIKHDMYTNLKQTSFSWDKRDRINNMSPGIWTSWKHTARLYSISTVPWSQEGFYVIYLAGSGDATCFVLPSMQMRVWLCVCVCLRKANRAGFTAHSLSNPLQCITHRLVPPQRHDDFCISWTKEKNSDRQFHPVRGTWHTARPGARCARMKLALKWDLTWEWEAVKHNDTADTMRRREETGAAKWTGDGGQENDKQS